MPSSRSAYTNTPLLQHSMILMMKILPVPLFVIAAANLVTGRWIFCGLVQPNQSRSDTLQYGGEDNMSKCGQEINVDFCIMWFKEENNTNYSTSQQERLTKHAWMSFTFNEEANFILLLLILNQDQCNNSFFLSVNKKTQCTCVCPLVTLSCVLLCCWRRCCRRGLSSLRKPSIHTHTY